MVQPMISYVVTLLPRFVNQVRMRSRNRREEEEIRFDAHVAEEPHQGRHPPVESSFTMSDDPGEILLDVDGDGEASHTDPLVTSATHRSATFNQTKSRLIRSRAIAPTFERRAASSSIVLNPDATDSRSGAQRYPVTLCSTTSAMPPIAVAKTGAPAAIAFNKEIGSP